MSPLHHARVLAVSAALLTGVLVLPRHLDSHGKLDLGIWYWHSPFALSAPDRELLESAGIRTIYVRTGTFTTDGKNVLLMLPQRWESKADGLSIVAVFNFDPGLLRHFSQLPVEPMARDMASRIAKSIADASSQGIEVKGVQLDIDCPTRLLPKYGDLLHMVRRSLRTLFPGVWSFSATALPTWLSSPDFDLVAKQVDFVAPQFYEGRVGRTLSTVKPVSDPLALQAGLRRLGRLGVPYYAGLPAYGHAMLFDQDGRLASMYRGLSAEDALRHQALRFESTTPMDEQGRRAAAETYIGEDLLCIRATRPDVNGRGKGDRIAYLLPSIEMVTRGLGIVDREASSNCRGVILYRFPEPNETTCLPLRSIDAAIGRKPERIDFDVRVHCRSIPYALIGPGTASTVPRELTLGIQPTGNVATEAAPNAFQALLEFDRPGIDDVACGDFDRAQVGTVDGGSFVPCGRARANTILLSRFSVLPGQKLRTGSIDLAADGPARIRVSWSAIGTGGLRCYRGSLPTRPLAEIHR